MRSNYLETLLYAMFMCVAVNVVAEDYDPSHISKDVNIQKLDIMVADEKRSREIPLRIYLPPNMAPSQAGEGESAKSTRVPVILFSHGLGGSREGSPFLGKHWAARGYAAVFLQHPGSDESVWKDQPLAQRMAAMREAASPKNYMLRAQDVTVVLDQLEKWSNNTKHELAGRLDTTRVGMSGHSFGGHTTQAVSGQSFPIGGQGLTDSRVKAAIVMSPSAPDRGDINVAFGKVATPWLLMTGTHDTAAIGNQTPESRRKVFAAIAPGDKYELVLDKAEHSVFTDRPLPGDKQPRNPNHHRVILALSTAFWDAYLRDNRDAKAWLTGDAPRLLMDAADVWHKK
jgi:dienelactone hydrolase